MFCIWIFCIWIFQYHSFPHCSGAWSRQSRAQAAAVTCSHCLRGSVLFSLNIWNIPLCANRLHWVFDSQCYLLSAEVMRALKRVYFQHILQWNIFKINCFIFLKIHFFLHIGHVSKTESLHIRVCASSSPEFRQHSSWTRKFAQYWLHDEKPNMIWRKRTS